AKVRTGKRGRRVSRSILTPEKQAALDLHIWNQEFPVGTPVVYYPRLPVVDPAETIQTTTRSEAWLMEGERVVMLDDVHGYVDARQVHRREVSEGEKAWNTIDEIRAKIWGPESESGVVQ